MTPKQFPICPTGILRSVLFTTSSALSSQLTLIKAHTKPQRGPQHVHQLMQQTYKITENTDCNEKMVHDTCNSSKECILRTRSQQLKMNGMNQVTLTLKICVACVYPALTQSWLRFPSHSISVSPFTPSFLHWGFKSYTEKRTGLSHRYGSSTFLLLQETKQWHFLRPLPSAAPDNIPPPLCLNSDWLHECAAGKPS